MSHSVVCELHKITVNGIYDCGGHPRTHATDAVKIKARFTPADAAGVRLQLPQLLEKGRDWRSEIDRLKERDPNLGDRRARIVVAADIFHEFLVIHPFRGGNGRVARAMLHLLLYDMDVLAPPFDVSRILAYRRDQYLNVLGDADAGNKTPLYNYVERACVQTVVDHTCELMTESPSNDSLIRRLSPRAKRFTLRRQSRLAANDDQFFRELTNLSHELQRIISKGSGPT